MFERFIYVHLEHQIAFSSLIAIETLEISNFMLEFLLDQFYSSIPKRFRLHKCGVILEIFIPNSQNLKWENDFFKER